MGTRMYSTDRHLSSGKVNLESGKVEARVRVRVRSCGFIGSGWAIMFLWQTEMWMD